MGENHDYFVQVSFGKQVVVMHLLADGVPLPYEVIALGFSMIFREILPRQPQKEEMVELSYGCMTCGYSAKFAEFTVSQEQWERYRAHLTDNNIWANHENLCTLIGAFALEALLEYMQELAEAVQQKKSLLARMFEVLSPQKRKQHSFSSS